MRSVVVTAALTAALAGTAWANAYENSHHDYHHSDSHGDHPMHVSQCDGGAADCTKYFDTHYTPAGTGPSYEQPTHDVYSSDVKYSVPYTMSGCGPHGRHCPPLTTDAYYSTAATGTMPGPSGTGHHRYPTNGTDKSMDHPKSSKSYRPTMSMNGSVSISTSLVDDSTTMITSETSPDETSAPLTGIGSRVGTALSAAVLGLIAAVIVI